MALFNNTKFKADVNKRIGKNDMTAAAKEAGVTYAALWRVCNASTAPNVNTLVNLLQWLGKPLDHYVNKEGIMFK